MAKLTKDELIKALTEKGVELAGDEKVDALRVLATENGIATDTEPEVPDRVKADVYTKQGGYVRTYSQEIHGDDFEALAEEFAANIKGKVQ